LLAEEEKFELPVPLRWSVFPNRLFPPLLGLVSGAIGGMVGNPKRKVSKKGAHRDL